MKAMKAVKRIWTKTFSTHQVLYWNTWRLISVTHDKEMGLVKEIWEGTPWAGKKAMKAMKAMKASEVKKASPPQVPSGRAMKAMKAKK